MQKRKQMGMSRKCFLAGMVHLGKSLTCLCCCFLPPLCRCILVLQDQLARLHPRLNPQAYMTLQLASQLPFLLLKQPGIQYSSPGEKKNIIPLLRNPATRDPAPSHQFARPRLQLHCNTMQTHGRPNKYARLHRLLTDSG